MYSVVLHRGYNNKKKYNLNYRENHMVLTNCYFELMVKTFRPLQRITAVKLLLLGLISPGVNSNLLPFYSPGYSVYTAALALSVPTLVPCVRLAQQAIPHRGTEHAEIRGKEEN
jgi:hypothetical protein